MSLQLLLVNIMLTRLVRGVVAVRTLGGLAWLWLAGLVFMVPMGLFYIIHWERCPGLERDIKLFSDNHHVSLYPQKGWVQDFYPHFLGDL